MLLFFSLSRHMYSFCIFFSWTKIPAWLSQWSQLLIAEKKYWKLHQDWMSDLEDDRNGCLYVWSVCVCMCLWCVFWLSNGIWVSNNTKQGLAQARQRRENTQKGGWRKKLEMSKTQIKVRKEVESSDQNEFRVYMFRMCYRNPKWLDANYSIYLVEIGTILSLLYYLFLSLLLVSMILFT